MRRGRSGKGKTSEVEAPILRTWAPIIIVCVLLTAYSNKSGSPAPMLDLSWRDKLDHFCVYGLLSVLVFQALPSNFRNLKRWLTAFILVSAFGMWDETVQHFNPARTGDPLDWLADSLGALTAVVLCSSFPSLQRLAAFKPLNLIRTQKSP